MTGLKGLAYLSTVVFALLLANPSPGRTPGVRDVAMVMFWRDLVVYYGTGTLANPTVAMPNDPPLYNAVGAPLSLM